MSSALVMFLYATAVAWCLPGVLMRLTSSGMSARLGLAAWLTAMASVLACLAVGLQRLVTAAVAGWSILAEAVCRSATGHACPPVVYRGAILEIPLGAAALGGALTAVVLSWQYGRRVQRAQRRTREHAEAALIAGRRLPIASEAVVLDVAPPAAYCVRGRPSAIVITTGALAMLDPAQLTAVIAHEKAHLAGSHHMLVALTRSLAATFPGVPLFTRGAAEVARLTEMRADDMAVRASGRSILATALLAMGTAAAVPARALGATTGDVTARVQRLMQPPHWTQYASNRLALIAVTSLLAAASAVLIRFIGPVAARALAFA